MRSPRPLVLTFAVLCAALIAGIGASVPAAAVSQTYIVVLEDSVNSPAQAAAAAGVMPTNVYQHALKGYAAPMSAAKAAAIAAKAERPLRRARRHRDHLGHAEPCDVGPGPHRPAEPAALELVHVRLYRAPG